MHCKGDYIRKGLPGPLQMQVASIVAANAIEISLHKGHYVKPHFDKQVLKGAPPPMRESRRPTLSIRAMNQDKNDKSK